VRRVVSDTGHNPGVLRLGADSQGANDPIARRGWSMAPFRILMVSRTRAIGHQTNERIRRMPVVSRLSSLYTEHVRVECEAARGRR
jgi:hypothetical protein